MSPWEFVCGCVCLCVFVIVRVRSRWWSEASLFLVLIQSSRVSRGQCCGKTPSTVALMKKGLHSKIEFELIFYKYCWFSTSFSGDRKCVSKYENCFFPPFRFFSLTVFQRTRTTLKYWIRTKPLSDLSPCTGDEWITLISGVEHT